MQRHVIIFKIFVLKSSTTQIWTLILSKLFFFLTQLNQINFCLKLKTLKSFKHLRFLVQWEKHRLSFSCQHGWSQDIPGPQRIYNLWVFFQNYVPKRSQDGNHQEASAECSNYFSWLLSVWRRNISTPSNTRCRFSKCSWGWAILHWRFSSPVLI